MDDRKKNIYDYCGCEDTIIPFVWRGAFIAKICGIEIPDDMNFICMSEKEYNEFASEQYSDALAHLLIMYGSGFIGYENARDLSKDAAKYSEEIYAAERFIIRQSEKDEKEQVTQELVEKIFLCTVNSKKYPEMQTVTFDIAQRLCEGPYTVIRNGFVFVKDVGFYTLLVNVGESMGCFHADKLSVYTGNQCMSGISAENIEKELFPPKEEKDEKERSGEKKKAEKKEEKFPELPFLLNLVNICYIQDIYGKPYSVEFIAYAKANNIPFDDNFAREYDRYVREQKLRVTVSATAKKRNICGEPANWFDYCTTKYLDKKIVIDEAYDLTEQIDLFGKVNKEIKLNDEFLIDTALNGFIEEHTLTDNTVIEVTFCGKKYLYLFKINGNEKIPLESEKFRRIPFDYNNVWTTVMEWSRSKLIQKKGNEIVVPESEMEKIAEPDREYAKRMIEEQYSLKKSDNRMLQKLSELKSYAKSQMDLKEQQAALKKERKKGIQEDNNK